MRFFDFILLKRNDWAHDRRAIEENLDRTSKEEPLWLVVFPEGTVVSKGTRKRSTAFAEKAGLVSFALWTQQSVSSISRKQDI
jgi:1-acyl-sn-glycerol-3-phosphate acyltransferase